MNESPNISHAPPTASSSDPARAAQALWEDASRDTWAHFIEHPYVLGPCASQCRRDDPKHNLFTLARYKFCAKMLIGKSRLLEIGCGDGYGLDLVLHEAKPESLTAVDFDAQLIDDNRRRLGHLDNVNFLQHNVACEPLPGRYNGAFCCDVIEHLHPDTEAAFLNNIVSVLDPHALFIVGVPNATAAQHASARSRATHINLKDAPSLRRLMSERFHNVLMFSMNDEVVHTGYHPMAHYLFALCCSKRSS